MELLDIERITFVIINNKILIELASHIYTFCGIKVTRDTYLLTWILGVASKQLRLLHGRVGDPTIVVNSLSPQMSELVEDAIAS